MKAIVYRRYGSPDRLESAELDRPVPGPGQVLIKVRSTALNAADWHLLRADPFLARFFSGLFRPKYPVLGSDVAGTVEALGPGASRFSVGDEVFGSVFEAGLGGLAEFVVATERCLARKPARLTFDEAAGLPMASLTALQGLRDHAQVKPGHRVLIHGASGGVGTFAVQWAKSLGAEVTAVCGPSNLEVVRSLGADRVLDYTKDDFTSLGPVFEAVLALNGNRELKDYLSVLGPTGVYVMVGGANRQLFQALLAGRRAKTFTSSTTEADLELVRQTVEAGRLKVIVDRTFPLAQTADAFRYLEEGHARGKIIVRVS
jgi:NADPH:quinone reductase-like Zn-dependent oxidoreductase